nr:reverse transcriptase domain-containing protein [Tanacetum cinerariifolium]
MPVSLSPRSVKMILQEIWCSPFSIMIDCVNPLFSDKLRGVISAMQIIVTRVFGFHGISNVKVLKVPPWKGVVRFRKKGQLAPRFVGPFEIIEKVSPVAYRLYLPEELNGVHDTFHVSNLKKCLADPTIQVPLDEIQVDAKLIFMEDPVEILEREFKKLKWSRIAIIKVKSKSRNRRPFWEIVETLVILGRPFLATAQAVIDVHEGKLSLRVGDETVTSSIRMKSKHSRNDYLHCADHTTKLIREQWVNTIDHDGEWTEAEDERDSNEVQAVSFYPRTEPVEPLKCEAIENQLKPSCVGSPKLELKELPEHLEYTFLPKNNKFDETKSGVTCRYPWPVSGRYCGLVGRVTCGYPWLGLGGSHKDFGMIRERLRSSAWCLSD